MTILRTDIEKALDELISNEEGMKFQGLAVILAKLKWPELIACERKNDLGLDAYASASLAKDRIGKGLACSLTATLGKIKGDATKIKNNFDDVSIIIFMVPRKVSNDMAKSWATEIQEEFGYKLIVVSREDIIMSLMIPSNAPLCRDQLSIPVTIEASILDLIEEALDAIADATASWLSHTRLNGRPFLPLQAAKIDESGAHSDITLDFEGIRSALLDSRRLVLEAPAGRGKTTTLVQLVKQGIGGGLAFFIDLPAWARTGIDILEFIACMPSFRSRNIDARTLAKLNREVHFTFLLNGWNEVTEINSEGAVIALRQLERDFPAAGIIVATRAHHVSPPLPGAFRVRLLPLTRSQRAEYLKQCLGRRADELGSKLDNDPTLDDLTRTPLILSEVTTIFQSGGVIPTTKIGVLDAVMRLLEQSDEHRSYLHTAPLDGHAAQYLTELATQLTMQGGTSIMEEEARTIINSVSVRLKDAGQFVTLPEPGSILNVLCAHHILERLDYPSVAFRFEHQQFQEFYAALLLKCQLRELVKEDNFPRNREFTKHYVNKPGWEEPLRMVAEEISALCVEKPSEPEAVNAGKRLIEMALGVDPIFAGELSRLCGEVIWKEVRSIVGECLRSWYRVADENHQQCALAGMLTSGSEDFKDIIIPLLKSDEQQVRLKTYRAGTEFHLSSLGPRWRDIVKGWKEDVRIEFVREVASRQWIPEIMEDFVLSDPSPNVRSAAVQSLSWSGSEQDIAKLLEALDEEGFKHAIKKISAAVIPPSLHGRTLELYQEFFSEAKDPLSRLRLLLKAAELGEINIEEKLKHELINLPSGKFEDAGEYIIKPAINIVRKSDPQWISHWVAGRIIDGSLWRDSWIDLVTSIPEDIKTKLLQMLGGEDLQHNHKRYIAILAAIADSSLAEAVFSNLFAIRRSMSNTRAPEDQEKWTITGQLNDLIRALPPNIAVSGLSNTFKKEFEAIEFTVAVDVLSTVGRDEYDLRSHLKDNLLHNLRCYLKNALDFVLAQDDFSGKIKANLASALARVGKPEDMPDLVQLIRADIERMRKVREARLRGERSQLAMEGVMSHANWNIQALTALDSEAADTFLLDLLNEPEYEMDAASALVSLARIKDIEKSFDFKPKQYSIIWEARTGQSVNPFNEERRRRYATAIKHRINTLLDERARSTQIGSFDSRLKRLTIQLAILDSHNSAEVVLDIMAFPGTWDGWGRVQALESLLFSGVQLPTEKTLNVLNPTIEHLCAQGLHHNQNAWLLKKCLCLLPFIDDPSIGIAKIQQVISETRFPSHELREIMTAIGNSRCEEALNFLLNIGDSIGNKLKQIREEWIRAIASLNIPESKRFLLSFIDPDIDEYPTQVNMEDHESDLLAAYIADIALMEDTTKRYILEVCDKKPSPAKRLLLSKVLVRLGTLDAALAGLSLISDDTKPSVPYELRKAFESVCLERRPYGKSGNAYTIVSKGSNEIRAKLFELALKDNLRKKSAYSFLGQIEVWRLECGKPNDEPRHPAFDSGEAWPLIK